MLRQLLSTTTLLDLPILAMAIFAAIFATVLVRATQRSRGAEFRRMAALPLEQDRQEEVR
jgi:mannose/fructose/N-acetylgalactosamine-specific phosphotransferase system component IIC